MILLIKKSALNEKKNNKKRRDSCIVQITNRNPLKHLFDPYNILPLLVRVELRVMYQKE